MGNKMTMVIDDYCELLCRELEKIVDSNDLSPSILEIGEIISETCKNFEKYKMMKYAEEHQDEIGSYYREGNDNSGNYNGYNGYNRYPDYMYNRGNDGSRQSSGENYNRAYRNYRGYNNYGHDPREINEHLIKELQKTMDGVSSQQAREAIRQQIHKLREEM